MLDTDDLRWRRALDRRPRARRPVIERPRRPHLRLVRLRCRFTADVQRTGHLRRLAGLVRRAGPARAIFGMIGSLRRRGTRRWLPRCNMYNRGARRHASAASGVMCLQASGCAHYDQASRCHLLVHTAAEASARFAKASGTHKMVVVAVPMTARKLSSHRICAALSQAMRHLRTYLGLLGRVLEVVLRVASAPLHAMCCAPRECRPTAA